MLLFVNVNFFFFHLFYKSIIIIGKILCIFTIQEFFMTIKENASLAGVSISTVSKVMNHKDSSISPETRERVLRIIKEFNYTPYSNSYINNTVTKSYTIGILIRSAEKNHSVTSIIQAARELGYTVLISECANNPDLEFRGVTALCRHGVDGVLWEPLNGDSLKYAESFRASRIPYILFNSTQTDGALNMDFEQMAYDATMALIRVHHKDIACLLSDSGRTERFLNGYKKCLFDAGIPYQENLVFHDITNELIHKITSHSITGIVSSHFGTANKLYGELYSRHYTIPYDVSLVSLQNASRDPIAFPKISSLSTPHVQFGYHLCEQLIEMIENPDHVPAPFVTVSSLNDDSTIAAPYTPGHSPILVVGSINIDNYLKMDHLPATGKSTITSSSSVYAGGKGINQAVGAAKLGAHVALIGAVGNDVDSDLIYEALDDYSIDANAVRRFQDTATGKAFIFVQKNGDSLISILAGANGRLSPEDIKQNDRLFENSHYCLVQTEIPQETVLAACRAAREHNVSTILKPSACTTLDPEILKYVDILVPNRDEINLLSPDGTLSEKADYFLNQGIHTVIVTLGVEGCYIKTADLEEYIPAAPFHAVDNTGACDALISALAVFLQDGYSLSKAIRIATYAAGFSITREGVPNSLVDRGTLESYIRQQEPELLTT